MKVKEIVVLEAIRKTRSKVPLPISGQWSSIKDVLKSLFHNGYLEIKDNEFTISNEGKKIILLFNDKRKEAIKPWEDFKKVTIEGNTIDARIPIASFNVKGKISEEEAQDYLENLNVFLTWESFFDWIKYLNKEGNDWQGQILHNFELHSRYNVGTDQWKKLGKDENAAIIRATKMLMPDNLVQITT